MAFAPHVRISFGGSLLGEDYATPEEIWACNVNATVSSNAIVPVQNNPGWNEDGYMAEIASDLSDWFHSAASGCVNQASLDYLKVNRVGPDGRYVDRTSTHRHDYTPAVFGGSPAVNPDIISVATSWSTSKARGPGSHGRIYLPNPSYGRDKSMHVPEADQDKARDAGLALLHILNNSGGAHTVYPCISSKVDGTNTDIIMVKVGSIKDVQRRRKNALTETYRTGIFLGAN